MKTTSNLAGELPSFAACQRWRNGRASYRPAGEPFDHRWAAVEPIDESTAKAYVLEHHLCNQKKCCVLVFSLCNGSEATLIMLRNGTPELRIAGSRVSQVGHRTGFTRSFMPWMTESLPRSISSNSDIRAWSR